MSHDQLFKELLQAFFKEFLELFYPAVAARLDFSRLTFPDKEVFTDLPEGSLRQLDLVAQAYTLEGEPELLLVHVEVQSSRDREFARRMFEYYALLRLRRRQPVFPIVVYLAPGTGGLVREQHEETLFGEEILTFRYHCVGLPDLPAEQYREVENPLAPALSALMKPGGTGRAMQKALLLQRTLRQPVDEARKSLLVNIVETYLALDKKEQQEFRDLVEREPNLEVKEMLTIYEERGIAKGIEQGIEQGILKGKRDAALRLLRLKFGGVPDATASTVQSIETEGDLDGLIDRIMSAQSLDELGLPKS